MTLVDIARSFDFVREVGGPNAGLWVGIFQRFTGNAPGDSWCASFVSFCLAVASKIQTKIPRTAVCQEIYDWAKKNGQLITTPEVGCLFLYVNDQDHAHHVGIVTSTSPLRGIAGNTSSDGKSSDGTGVFEHEINTTVFVHTGL